jgi:HEAT repeats
MHKNQPTIRRVTQKCRVSLLRRSWKVLLSFCVIAVLAGPTFAQPLIDSVASIDSLVINGDYVYVGKIIKVRDEPIPGGSKMPGFTFEVDEYLKVPMEEDLTPEIKQRGMFVSPPTAKYKDWMNRSCRLLIISNDSNPHCPTVIELAPNRAAVFTAKFSLLHDPSEIIQAAKDAIERTPSNIRRLCTLCLMLPREIYKGTHWEGGDGLMLEVPADAQLEKWAIESVDHKNPLIRRHAAQSLRYFKSERNAKLVAKLLDDPESDVRYAAHQTLERWELQANR